MNFPYQDMIPSMADIYCYELNCDPLHQKSDVEVLTFTVNAFGDRAFKKKIKVEVKL